MQNKNVTLRPVHVRRESNQCLAIRNATHWADTRSIERISCYVVICMFTCFTVSACYCMVGLINITYFVDSEIKLNRPKLYSVLHTTEQPVYNIVANFHVNLY